MSNRESSSFFSEQKLFVSRKSFAIRHNHMETCFFPQDEELSRQQGVPRAVQRVSVSESVPSDRGESISL